METISQVCAFLALFSVAAFSDLDGGRHLAHDLLCGSALQEKNLCVCVCVCLCVCVSVCVSVCLCVSLYRQVFLQASFHSL